MEHLNDLLSSAEVCLRDEVLDAIDVIVPLGTDVGRLDMADDPPAIQQTTLKQPADERTAS